MTTAPKLRPLSIFDERYAAGELLAELRRGTWRRLPPNLLLEPPTFATPGGKGSTPPRYLYTLVDQNVYLQNPRLEVVIMYTDYQEALWEIDSLGLADTWREFFNTKQQLYRLEVRSKNVKVQGAYRVTEQAYVTQNRDTGKAHRDALSCIWRRAAKRPWDGDLKRDADQL